MIDEDIAMQSEVSGYSMHLYCYNRLSRDDFFCVIGEFGGEIEPTL